jgi:predicted transcriptional regulator
MTDRPVSDAPDLATLVDLLDDEHVRSILAATSAEPLSASELAERCGLSDSAVYRRTDRLVAADLLRERTRPRTDGHHDTVYVAALDRFELTVRDGALDWTVERTERDVADELTRLWGKF